MHLPLALLASVSLVALEASAALLPKSPRTSILDRAQLKREIQRRQLTTADLKRRRNGPKRKRADPSSLPPTCAVGADTLTNGDFETGTLSPWNGQSSEAFDVGEYGIGSTTGTSSQAVRFTFANGINYANLKQPVSLCSGVRYRATFDLGVIGTGASCRIDLYTFSPSDGSSSVSIYAGTPCPGDATVSCPLTNGRGTNYVSLDVEFDHPSTATDEVLFYSVACTSDDPFSLGGTFKQHVLDRVTLSRAA